MQWLRQKYIEENDLEEQKEEAKLSIEEMIEQMQSELIAQGIEDENQRLLIIIDQLMQQEEMLTSQETYKRAEGESRGGGEEKEGESALQIDEL